MISSNDLEPGMAVQRDGKIFVMLEQSQSKATHSTMVVKAKVRNLRAGSNVELSWGGDDKVTPAHIKKKEMQYLYDTDDTPVFMDNETYEQTEVPEDRLKWEMNFMKPNDNVNIPIFESEILDVVLPDRVALQTVECEPAVKDDTTTSVSENTTLEPGLEVEVLLFVNQDEMAPVNTSGGKYSGRAKD